jgi:hypothetical protein
VLHKNTLTKKRGGIQMKEERHGFSEREISQTLDDLYKLYRNISGTKKSDGVFSGYKIRTLYSSFIEEQSNHLDKKKISQIFICIGLIDLIIFDMNEVSIEKK